MSSAPPTPPFAHASSIVLSFPAPSVLLVTLDRPEKLNALLLPMHAELDRVWRWFDECDALLVAVFTGSRRAWCVGADLDVDFTSVPLHLQGKIASTGFGGISPRQGRKPVIAAVIAAVNGLCVGGAMEMLMGCDIVLASTSAVFSLPDVKVGLTGLGGGFPRLVHRIGRQRAVEMTLTGRNVSAEEAERWGLVKRVVEGEKLMEEALGMATLIAANSPDAVIATRAGLVLGEDGVGALEAGTMFIEKWRVPLMLAGNTTEGIRAFREKRKPEWIRGKV